MPTKEGPYSKMDMKIRQDRSTDDSGNPKGKALELNWDKLESNRGPSGQGGSHPNPKDAY